MSGLSFRNFSSLLIVYILFSGEANVLQLFIVTEGKKKVPIAGCRCTSGMLMKKQRFRLIRDDEILYDGMCHL